MRVLMLGDIVGQPGRTITEAMLERLKENYRIDLTIANGENAAGGIGITEPVARELFSIGIDVLTMGNHVWDKKEIFAFIDREPRIVRPLNYPQNPPGKGSLLYETKDGTKTGIISLSGRVYMNNLDCPFQTVAAEVERMRAKTPLIIVDFHAEATSEKVAMGWHLDGKVSVVAGTHTHVQTADERVLPGGTAYITDLGMTGPMNSVIGVKKELVLAKFLTQMPTRFYVAGGDMILSGAVIDIDAETGRAKQIERIMDFLPG
ncbi:MAG: TIGR00282 family metallophosphoesterase [bacterium]